MNLSKYFKTPLEQSIEGYYIANGIMTPEDLTIDRIANIFEVDVAYNELRTFSDNELRVIFLCLTDDLNAQRLSFFHELCHVLRHAGDQRQMPELFRQLQEADADRFILYAALPFFMLEQVPLPLMEDETIGLIAEVFRIPPRFVNQRMTQIKDRISGIEFMTNISYTATGTEVSSTPSLSSETTVKGVYGFEDLSRPHTLVIEKRGGFDLTGELHIGIDGTFKSCDPISLIVRDGAFIRSGDLTVPQNRNGYVTINMARVAWRHGTTATRLFLPMEAVDDAINF